MKLVLVSGLSGSGKSVALKALEDAGYFAVDNLPVPLVAGLLANLSDAPRVAVSVDVRTGESLMALPQLLAALSGRGTDVRLLFIDAADDAIARRFAETRRPHPLAERIAGGVTACIAEERRLLGHLADIGHRIDTSGVSAHVLRAWINDWLGMDRRRVALTFQSFGYKFGLPLDADLVFDARVLPNPYYDPHLRPLTGRDDAVRDFLSADTEVVRFVDGIADYLDAWLPGFARDNRTALTVAVGCTGGRHRSVFVVDALATRFSPTAATLVRHRDIAAS